MRKFYQKELPESPVYVSGHPLIFDFLETEDAALIAELDKCVMRGVGGVSSITPEQFAEEVKKKAHGNPSAGSLKPRQQRQELTAVQWDALRVAGDAVSPGQFAKPQQPDHRPHRRHGLPNPNVAMPDPIEVPSVESFPEVSSKPPLAKLKAVQAMT